MANEKNLIPLNKLDKEEAKKIQSMGGIACGEAKRKKKSLKEELEILLEIADEKGLTNQTLMSLAMIDMAKLGNVQAFNTVRDTIGQKPKEVIEQEITQTNYDVSKLSDDRIKELLNE